MCNERFHFNAFFLLKISCYLYGDRLIDLKLYWKIRFIGDDKVFGVLNFHGKLHGSFVTNNKCFCSNLLHAPASFNLPCFWTRATKRRY